jgi:intein/homing endonuclease
MFESVLDKKKFINSYNRNGSGEKFVESINWLPLQRTPELAELIGFIFADGSIERSYDRQKIRPKRVDFISDNQVLRNRVYYLILKIFGVKSKKHMFRNTQGFRIANASIARALWISGIPMGGKVSQNYDIPDWIKTSKKEIKSSFIRSYFDCDASKPYKIIRSKSTFAIRLTINKTEDRIPNGLKFLESMKNILNEFEIVCNGPYIRKSKIYVNRHGRKTIMLELLIQRQLSFLNYYRMIGFSEPNKKEKLKKCVREIVINSKYTI